MKNWAFRRPYCSPVAGFVQADSGEQALKLVNYAYGSCGRTSVFCAKTGEEFIDDYGNVYQIRPTLVAGAAPEGVELYITNKNGGEPVNQVEKEYKKCKACNTIHLEEYRHCDVCGANLDQKIQQGIFPPLKNYEYSV